MGVLEQAEVFSIECFFQIENCTEYYEWKRNLVTKRTKFEFIL